MVAGRFFFIFVFFKKKITEIYFWFQVLQFYTPIARQGGGRGPTARPRGGRDLYVNKNKFILRRGPWREPAARQGGRQAPSKDLCAKQIYFYLHIGPYRLPVGR